MSGEQRLFHGVLAVGGSMLVHAIVYTALSAGSGASGHGATDGLFAIAISALMGVAALAVGRAAVRRGTVSTVRMLPLALAQTGLFAGQELLEGIGSGLGLYHAVTAPTFVVGLAIQPLVAWLLVVFIRSARRLGESLDFTGYPAPPPVTSLAWQPAFVAVAVSSDIQRGTRTRAPPE